MIATAGSGSDSNSGRQRREWGLTPGSHTVVQWYSGSVTGDMLSLYDYL